jgi:hypothetical protein
VARPISVRITVGWLLRGPILGDREVVKVLLHDRRDEQGQRGLVIDGEHRRAHDLGNEARHIAPLANDLRAEVGVGHDADRLSLLVDDQDRADIALAHHRCGVTDGRIGSTGQHVAHGVHATHIIAGVACLLVTPRGSHRLEPVAVHRLRHIGRKVGGKEHRHPGRLVKELFESFLRKHVQERVVLGLRARGVRPIRKQCPHAEDVAVITHVDEHGLPLDQLSDSDLALHDYIELGSRVIPLLEDDLIGLEVPNANAARDAVEELGVEPIERRMVRQAVGHREDHGIRRHARYLSKARSTISATSLEIPGREAMRSSSAFISLLLPGS